MEAIHHHEQHELNRERNQVGNHGRDRNDEAGKIDFAEEARIGDERS